MLICDFSLASHRSSFESTYPRQREAAQRISGCCFCFTCVLLHARVAIIKKSNALTLTSTSCQQCRTAHRRLPHSSESVKEIGAIRRIARATYALSITILTTKTFIDTVIVHATSELWRYQFQTMPLLEGVGFPGRVLMTENR